jgi:hypothetical protein
VRDVSPETSSTIARLYSAYWGWSNTLDVLLDVLVQTLAPCIIIRQQLRAELHQIRTIARQVSCSSLLVIGGRRSPMTTLPCLPRRRMMIILVVWVHHLKDGRGNMPYKYGVRCTFVVAGPE